MDQENPAVDPRNGFDSVTKIFHSLRPPLELPPQHVPLSVAAYALSLRRNLPWPDSVALIDSATCQRVSYSDFVRRTNTLAANLQATIGLSKGDTAFILSPNSIQIPILNFSLLTIGVVVSPANPLSTKSEILRLVELSKPVIAFSTSASAHKLPKLRLKTVIIDSPEFDSMTTSSTRELEPVEVRQSDLAAVMYSSGTTGKVKGVMLTHRNLIFTTDGFFNDRMERESPAVFLYTVPYFHIFGFLCSWKSVAVNDTVVVMEKYELSKMLRAVEEFRVSHLMLVPAVVVAMVKPDADHITASYDLSSLESVGCGAAPLGKDMITAFKSRFPNVVLAQGYGLTETTGVAFRTVNPEELSQRWDSTGRLLRSSEAKIVDPDTGEALLPCQQGELWIRGPSIMKGYIDDPETTRKTIVSGGWLRTGDLCYIDEEGLLYVVDRLKELIKYKGYQVAPAELEQLLLSHPMIVDAAVIPYPDEEAGELPMAVVVRKSKCILSESEVIDFVAKQVSPYKKIRRVVFVDSIPKTGTGKISRKELKNILAPGSLSNL
ncbi:hypothetical protein FNV43_RR14172 [Rhamnella rubrinervis]|uniref:4-coumarate--CoA ligase n=1 Tax=Rhamnella rubrinervis TaxID=2594499 RepID=A0A8K0H2Q6_9ROSA|nr:hypothetical protein FNV43_RR14172 [Rhamnella rubrinervis]